jgi:predicted transcriptional regulator
VNSTDAGGLLGPLETEVMAVLWSAGEALSVRAVLERLNEDRRPELAYTTVMTVLSRLADKDMLIRRSAGRRYVYEPVAEDAAGLAVREVLRHFGELAVARFVDEARADPALRRRLQALTRTRRADHPG